ncbi:MAG: adhesin [Nitrospirales bacterium]|nr:MAG: adhesin [Nitrospirales bacterium]
MDLRKENNTRMKDALGSFARITLMVSLVLVNLGMAERPPIDQGGRLQIVTSIPDLADLTSKIGGEHVNVESLAKGLEDPHGVPVKPSFLPKLNQADVLVVMGLQNEHSWLAALIDVARNPNILPGNPGYIDSSVHISPKQVPVVLSRREGDLHPQGNPHFNLDPSNAKFMAQAIAEGLARIYPPGHSFFQQNLKRFEQKIDEQIQKWMTLAAPLQGVPFVSYHQDTIYFAERFGMKEVGHIEIRPGIEPTQRHLVKLVETMKAGNVQLILREPYFSDQLPNWVAEQTGAQVAKFLIMVGGSPEVQTYEDLIEFNLQSILDAMQRSQRALQN